MMKDTVNEEVRRPYLDEDDRLGSDGKFDPLYTALSRAQDALRDARQQLDRLNNLPMQKDSLTRRIFTTLGF